MGVFIHAQCTYVCVVFYVFIYVYMNVYECACIHMCVVCVCMPVYIRSSCHPYNVLSGVKTGHSRAYKGISCLYSLPLPILTLGNPALAC